MKTEIKILTSRQLYFRNQLNKIDEKVKSFANNRKDLSDLLKKELIKNEQVYQCEMTNALKKYGKRI